jgi:hypothetical protein
VQTEVGQRVAQGGHLPVDEGPDGAEVGGVQDRVVEPQVTMDHRGGRLRGDAGLQPGEQRLDVRQFPGPDPRPLVAPATDLPGQIPLGAAEVGQPALGVRHRVQRGQRVDQTVRGALHVLGRMSGHVLAGPQDHAVDVRDDGERHTEHGEVLAQRHRARNRDAGALQGVRHPVLAAHVVGGGCESAERRAPQYPPAVAVGHQIGEVGPAAVQQLSCHGAHGLGHVRGEEVAQGVQSQPLGCLDGHARPSIARTCRPTVRLAIAHLWVSVGPS